jgi:hypothetical protein
MKEKGKPSHDIHSRRDSSEFLAEPILDRTDVVIGVRENRDSPVWARQGFVN